MQLFGIFWRVKLACSACCVLGVRCRFYVNNRLAPALSYGPPWAHYLSGYQDRLLGGPLGLLDLGHTAPDGLGRKDYGGEVLG
jgi:hypothetical protein